MTTLSMQRCSSSEWRLPRSGKMHVPGVIFSSESLLEGLDDKVFEQVVNVACLPGIVKASFAMPDAHWGYGFPIGGVAAFDADQGGVVSAGGVGFDISCGVRTLCTDLTRSDVEGVKEALAAALARSVPAGVGSTGRIHLDHREMEAMLLGGAGWAVEHGYGEPADLARIEELGCVAGADPDSVSVRAKRRQRDQMGTLGSGNHYLEVQQVAEVYDPEAAGVFDLGLGSIVISVHCGSRGLGHQIGTDFLARMARRAPRFGIHLPDRELACAPIHSALGRAYLGAMRAGINCALANRQIVTHLVRQAVQQVFPAVELRLLYDVSHNTCKEEEHLVDGELRRLFVHRKGATRAFGPGHRDLPESLREVGQPVLIGGTMGTESYVLVGTAEGMQRAFGSACHGAGRCMSRNQARRRWRGEDLVRDLGASGVLIWSPSMRGVAEEAPGAYKNVSRVAEATEYAGLARRVARLIPMVCIKG